MRAARGRVQPRTLLSFLPAPVGKLLGERRGIKPLGGIPGVIRV